MHAGGVSFAAKLADKAYQVFFHIMIFPCPGVLLRLRRQVELNFHFHNSAQDLDPTLGIAQSASPVRLLAAHTHTGEDRMEPVLPPSSGSLSTGSLPACLHSSPLAATPWAHSLNAVLTCAHQAPAPLDRPSDPSPPPTSLAPPSCPLAHQSGVLCWLPCPGQTWLGPFPLVAALPLTLLFAAMQALSTPSCHGCSTSPRPCGGARCSRSTQPGSLPSPPKRRHARRPWQQLLRHSEFDLLSPDV